jgi:hypothetical protein
VRVVAEPGSTHGVHAVLGAVNVEPVEGFAVPAEYRLHDCVQFGDRGLGRQEQAPPDQRADPMDHRPQLVNVVVATGNKISILGHRVILARRVRRVASGADTGKGFGG